MSILNSQLSVTSTPLVEGGARGLGTLDSDQASVVIGEPIHIAFGKRLTDSGGVLVSPPASEARFESYTDSGTDYIKAYYQLVLSDGEIGRIEVRDVFQQSCRVGTSYAAYSTRAGQWVAGNALSSSVDVPQFCGTGGSYEGLTMMSFENAIPAEFEQWKRQVHVFVRNGVKVERLIEQDTDSSNNFADLVYYLLQRTARLPVSQIETVSLTTAARFLAANNLWCDTVLQQSTNLVDWLQKTAPLFLLRRARISGKETLKPLLPTNSDGTINTGFISWTYTFTNEHILKDGFEVRYTALSDRKPFAALMIWRQQPDDDIGLVRTTEVRYFGTATSGPYEQHDLTQYVTTENHAVKIGTYILARRRYIEHTLRLVVAPAAYIGSIAVGDIVRVNSSNTDQDGNTLDHNYLYEVDSIGKTLTGNVELRLTHFPIDDQGRSLVALDVSRAQGTNFLLPTGREAVSCDSNDPFDVTFLPIWPTIDWTFNFDFPFDVPIGGGTWTYDPTDQEWDNPEYDPIDPNENPDVLFPDQVDIEIPDPDVDLFNLNQGTTPTIGLSELTVSYPRTAYYDVYASNYALVKGKVSVDRPPFSNLEIFLASTLGNARIVIPRAENEAIGPYETEFTLAASLNQPFYCQSGAVEVSSVDGGGFTEYTLPDEQGFTICPYVGTASLSSISFTSTQCQFTIGIDKPCLTNAAVIKLAVGDVHWDYDNDNDTWRWTTDEYTQRPLPKVIEVELEAYNALIDDYLFNAISGQWEYIGTGTPGSTPNLPQPPTPESRTVTFDTVSEALQPNLRIWILEARQGGFSSIYYDKVKQVASPPSGPQPFVLLHFDDTAGSTTYVDSSTNEFTVSSPTMNVSPNDVQTSDTYSKFGGLSLKSRIFAGLVEVESANWTIAGDEDFTIDFWIKYDYAFPNSISPIIFDFTEDVGGGSEQIQFFLYDGSPNIWNNDTSTDYIWMSEAQITDQNWHHVAIERFDGNFYCYLDGVVSNDSYANANPLSASTFYIGNKDILPDGNASSAIYHYIDEFRIINYGAYEGQSFTPPTAPYDNP
jgi:hypothetical protein